MRCNTGIQSRTRKAPPAELGKCSLDLPRVVLSSFGQLLAESPRTEICSPSITPPPAQRQNISPVRRGGRAAPTFECGSVAFAFTESTQPSNLPSNSLSPGRACLLPQSPLLLYTRPTVSPPWPPNETHSAHRRRPRHCRT